MEIRPHPEGLKQLRVEAPEYDATFERVASAQGPATGPARLRGQLDVGG